VSSVSSVVWWGASGVTFSTEDLESKRGEGVGSFRIDSPREAVSWASLSWGRTLGERSPVVATLVRVGGGAGIGGLCALGGAFNPPADPPGPAPQRGLESWGWGEASLASFCRITGARFFPRGKLSTGNPCGCWAARALSLQSSKIPGGVFCQHDALKGDGGGFACHHRGHGGHRGEGGLGWWGAPLTSPCPQCPRWFDEERRVGVYYYGESGEHERARGWVLRDWFSEGSWSVSLTWLRSNFGQEESGCRYARESGGRCGDRGFCTLGGAFGPSSDLRSSASEGPWKLGGRGSLCGIISSHYGRSIPSRRKIIHREPLWLLGCASSVPPIEQNSGRCLLSSWCSEGGGRGFDCYHRGHSEHRGGGGLGWWGAPLTPPCPRCPRWFDEERRVGVYYYGESGEHQEGKGLSPSGLILRGKLFREPHLVEVEVSARRVRSSLRLWE